MKIGMVPPQVAAPSDFGAEPTRIARVLFIATVPLRIAGIRPCVMHNPTLSTSENHQSKVPFRRLRKFGLEVTTCFSYVRNHSESLPGRSASVQGRFPPLLKAGFRSRSARVARRIAGPFYRFLKEHER